MTTCKECKERLYPENPESVFFAPWRNEYLRPICETCGHIPEVESVPPAPEPEWVSGQWGVVKKLAATISYLQNKINFLYDKKKKKSSKFD